MSANPLYDLSLLRAVSVDNAFIKKMLEVFLQQADDSTNRLVVASKEENWMEIKQAVHQLKSSLKTIKANTVLETIHQLEQFSALMLTESNAEKPASDATLQYASRHFDKMAFSQLMENFQSSLGALCYQLRMDLELL